MGDYIIRKKLRTILRLDDNPSLITKKMRKKKGQEAVKTDQDNLLIGISG